MKIIDVDGNLIEIDVFFDKKPTKGRPKKILTQDAIDLIERLASIMCTEEEIAMCLGVNVNTLNTEENKDLFKEAIKKGNSKGKSSLRHYQFEVAKKGNPTMLIWLGRQYLGQTDKVELDADIKTENIEITTIIPTAEDMERVKKLQESLFKSEN